MANSMMNKNRAFHFFVKIDGVYEKTKRFKKYNSILANNHGD